VRQRAWLALAVRAAERVSPGVLDLSVVEQWQPLRDEWPALAERCGNPFLSWEWLTTWWRHFGDGRRLRLVVIRRRGELIGVVPLYEWRNRPVSVLRLVGQGTSDELGPVCAAEDRADVERGLASSLRSMPWDALLAEDQSPLPGASAQPALLGGCCVRRVASPVVCFGDGGWDGYLRARSRNFREQVRRRRRALERDGRARFRLVTQAGELPGALDALFRLHSLRWPGGSQFLRDAAFHREVAELALCRGWLRLWVLEVDGIPAAASYGFRFGAVENYYQAGRDPRFDHLSVGFALLAHVLHDAADAGMTEYRLLRGREDYKQRFATHVPELTTVLIARSNLATRALPLLAALSQSESPFLVGARNRLTAYLR
jgi:CelD/BcsL family acetyltransferase involved in cellulose biosynthesis